MGGRGGKRVSRSSHIYTPFLNFWAYFESRTIFENILSDLGLGGFAELAGTGRVKGTKLPCIREVMLQLAVYCLFGPTLTLGCDPGVWLSCNAVG